MIIIKFNRIGRKKKPYYNIIVIDKKKKNKIIEKLGFYNPITKKKIIKKKKINYWISKGADLSLTVKYLINKDKQKKK